MKTPPGGLVRIAGALLLAVMLILLQMMGATPAGSAWAQTQTDPDGGDQDESSGESDLSSGPIPLSDCVCDNLTVNGWADLTDGDLKQVRRIRGDYEYIDFLTATGGARGIRAAEIGVDSTYTNADVQLDLLGGNSLWVKDKIWAGGELWSNSNLSVYGTAYIGKPATGEGGEIILRAGSTGNLWTLDNYYGELRAHHDGTTEISVHSGGTLDVHGNDIINVGSIVPQGLLSEEEAAQERIDRFEEGDVLCWQDARLEKCGAAADPLVQAVADGSGKPRALGVGVVKVIGPVKAGDYLIASDVPGYAMATSSPTFGIVIAQALEESSADRGLVKAMIRKM